MLGAAKYLEPPLQGWWLGCVFVPISHCISLCSPPAASNLRCRECALEEPYIGCLPGVSECTPKAGHPCMTVNISYSEWGVQFLLQGCIVNPSRCGMVKELMVPEYHINVTCCSHASFCNKWPATLLCPCLVPIPLSPSCLRLLPFCLPLSFLPTCHPSLHSSLSLPFPSSVFPPPDLPPFHPLFLH
uniref:Uncharacterized protein n=1 Tax=Chelonoidis abingdonii TaxID=106734 RepID=A0A8C0G0D2_CHEAB